MLLSLFDMDKENHCLRGKLTKAIHACSVQTSSILPGALRSAYGKINKTIKAPIVRLELQAVAAERKHKAVFWTLLLVQVLKNLQRQQSESLCNH